MLHLLAPTDPSWVEAVESDLDRLLSDHAHCELKAAQSALSLLGRFACELPEAVPDLVALAREETAHFHEVHQRLLARGNTLPAPDVDGYVQALRAAARSEKLADDDLRGFYRALMVAEARHYKLFYDLASARFGEPTARTRLATLASREAEVAHRLPLGPTVHG